MTILFGDIIFGPVKSRRLGVSLGINLLPLKGKLCNFDCLYCECGFNVDGRGDSVIPRADEVYRELESKLKEDEELAKTVQNITFSGNGEPTLHPNFKEIVDGVIELRDRYAKNAKISVLTNGSRIGESEIAEALLAVDNAIIKIDSPYEESIILIDRPQYQYSLEEMEKNLIPFRDRFVLQTMFLKGSYEGKIIDNSTPGEIEEWYKLIERVKPREIMIYTIDRETPHKELYKVTVERMEEIAAPLRAKGYKVDVSG